MNLRTSAPSGSFKRQRQQSASFSAEFSSMTTSSLSQSQGMLRLRPTASDVVLAQSSSRVFASSSNPLTGTSTGNPSSHSNSSSNGINCRQSARLVSRWTTSFSGHRRSPIRCTNGTSVADSSNIAASNGIYTGAIQDAILSGVLSKRAPVFHNWMTRYFVLSRSCLRYFKTNNVTTNCHAATEGNGGLSRPPSSVEKKLLRGEIVRGDLLEVETTDRFKHRSFSFVLVVRKRHAARSTMALLKERRGRSQSSATNSGASPQDNSAVTRVYLQATREEERDKWVKTLRKWIQGESPANIGHEILQYVVTNEYSHSRYENKLQDAVITSPQQYQQQQQQQQQQRFVSPAEVAGRKIEEDFPVLANLMRDMHDCRHEDEMVYILDQVLGEINDGACSNYIKKMISAAGEVKLESTPSVWTPTVKQAYGNIMKVLLTQTATTGTLNQKTLGASSSSFVGSQNGSTTGRTASLVRQCSEEQRSAMSEYSFHRFYKLGRKLGAGAFSVVHIATHRDTRKQVAVKCIARSGLGSQEVIALKQEVEIMASLDHPNLVPLLDYYEEEKYYYIVTPLCTGGELFDALVTRKSYTEDDARVLMKKLASAIAYIHSRGIVHRDLKPENILLKTSAPGAEIMIADFGFARPFKGSRSGTACGTPGYVAPEVVRGEPYGKAIDCWSLGVILYILLCGYPPFPGQNHAKILEKVVNADYQFDSPAWDHVSDEAKDLVRRLLNVDPKLRYTATETLNHVWMNPSSLLKLQGTDANRLSRANSDLSPALNQMRKFSMTHAKPKITEADMESMDLSEVAIFDLDLLNKELEHVADELASELADELAEDLALSP